MMKEESQSSVVFALHMKHRDPKAINQHLAESQFEDVLAEPDGVRSADCVWRSSRKCFNLWKRLCYHISTFLCSTCLSMSWGCQFAFIAFIHVWYITPFMKLLEMNCACAKKLYGMCVSCCVEPVCESFGAMFHAFRTEGL